MIGHRAIEKQNRNSRIGPFAPNRSRRSTLLKIKSNSEVKVKVKGKGKGIAPRLRLAFGYGSARGDNSSYCGFPIRAYALRSG